MPNVISYTITFIALALQLCFVIRAGIAAWNLDAIGILKSVGAFWAVEAIVWALKWIGRRFSKESVTK